MNHNSEHASAAKRKRVWFEIYPQPRIDFSSLGAAGKRAVKAIVDHYDINLVSILANLEERQLKVRSFRRAGRALGVQSDDYSMWEDLGLRFMRMGYRLGRDEIVVEFV